ncbi:MAG TPA: hypothetical protein VH599_04655 [Ktedonobacterales bacterium]
MTAAFALTRRFAAGTAALRSQRPDWKPTQRPASVTINTKEQPYRAERRRPGVSTPRQ